MILSDTLALMIFRLAVLENNYPVPLQNPFEVNENPCA